MAELKSHLDVYRLLPQTNCRDCGLPACLAFSAMVIQNTKRLSDCPHLANEVIDQHDLADKTHKNQADSFEEDLAKLSAQVKQIDLASSAERLGAKYIPGRLVVSCLSKDFSVDDNGVVASGCHVNGWVAGPLLNYVLFSRGLETTGEWVSMRELKGGQDWQNFFEHRCEKILQKLVDGYTNLFEDLIDIFDAKPAPSLFDSDIAVVLKPLPKVPVLICYWKPEDGMDSSLNIFFDRTADDNMGAEHLYSLCFGMTLMFEKIAQTHGK